MGKMKSKERRMIQVITFLSVDKCSKETLKTNHTTIAEDFGKIKMYFYQIFQNEKFIMISVQIIYNFCV